MNVERLKYWIEVFDSKAWEYDWEAKLMLQDEDFTKDIGRDVAEGFAQELKLKADRARKIAAKLRARNSS